MLPRFTPLALGVLIVGGFALAQPKAEFPVLNPGNAKLLRTSDPLDSLPTGIALVEAKGIVVVGCDDGSLRTWARGDGKDFLEEAKVQKIAAHPSSVTAVAAGGGVAASAARDGKILVWNLPGEKAVQTLAHGAAVRALAVSADGKTIASAGDDNAVQLWNSADGKPIRKLIGPADWLLAVAFSPDGKFAAAGGQDGKLWLWETATGRTVFDVPSSPPAPKGANPPPPTNVVGAIAFSPDGKTVAQGGSDAKLYLHQATDGKLLRTGTGHTHTLTGIAFHPAGQLVLSSSKDRTLRVWNVAGANVVKVLEGHTAWAEGVVLADKGTRAVSTGADRTVRVWDLGAPPPPKLPPAKKK
jgi:WD40 repeat protein